jgi:hypothetical protein
MNWGATNLAANAATIANKHPNFAADPALLIQATAASWNLGPNGFTGNPATIDAGSTDSRGEGYPGNYGRNIMDIMTCFQ